MPGLETMVYQYSLLNNKTAAYSLTEGSSTETLDFNAVRGYNAHFGYVDNTASSNPVIVEVSNDGTNYADAFTVPAAKSVSIDGMNINTIKLTRKTGDSAGEVVLW